MRLAKGEARPTVTTAKLEVEIEKSLIEQIGVMESYTKISKAELIATAIKRFIAAHNDYFPDDYKKQQL